MDWKKRQRHLAEMRWKQRGHKEIMLPPMPAPRVLKVINNPPLHMAGLDGPFRHVAKGVKPGPMMIRALDRWGCVDEKPVASPLKCPWNYIARLEKRGFKVLGRGAYSTVLGKDGSDKVIKVSRTLDNWIDYVQWGAKHGYAGNFVPKVYSWKLHGKLEEEDDYGRTKAWSTAVVERMADTVCNPALDQSLVINLYYPALNGNTMAQLYMDDLCPGSAKFFKELAANRFVSDVAGKNVMIRKDGSLCVTDPTCGTLTTTKKRLRTGDFSPAPLKGINQCEYSGGSPQFFMYAQFAGH